MTITTTNDFLSPQTIDILNSYLDLDLRRLERQRKTCEDYIKYGSHIVAKQYKEELELTKQETAAVKKAKEEIYLLTTNLEM